MIKRVAIIFILTFSQTIYSKNINECLVWIRSNKFKIWNDSPLRGFKNDQSLGDPSKVLRTNPKLIDRQLITIDSQIHEIGAFEFEHMMYFQIPKRLSTARNFKKYEFRDFKIGEEYVDDFGKRYQVTFVQKEESTTKVLDDGSIEYSRSHSHSKKKSMPYVSMKPLESKKSKNIIIKKSHYNETRILKAKKRKISIKLANGKFHIVEVIYYDGKKSMTGDPSDAVAMLLSHLPLETVVATKKIIIPPKCRGDNIAEMSSYHKDGYTTWGDAYSNTDLMAIFPNNKELSKRIRTVRHEHAHNIANYLWKNEAIPTKKWKEAMVKDGKNLTNHKNGEDVEDFAVGFDKYLDDIKTFRNEYSHRSAILDQLFTSEVLGLEDNPFWRDIRAYYSLRAIEIVPGSIVVGVAAGAGVITMYLYNNPHKLKEGMETLLEVHENLSSKSLLEIKKKFIGD